MAFWIGIAKYQNMLGHHPFKDLALYALSCLSSPGHHPLKDLALYALSCLSSPGHHPFKDLALYALSCLSSPGHHPFKDLALYALSCLSSPRHHPFKDLALYALSCLSSPVSNAVVERIFSHMTSIKTKQRHRMETHMLQSIIRIKTWLHFQGISCLGMKVTPKMLDLFCANMYCDAKEAEEPK